MKQLITVSVIICSASFLGSLTGFTVKNLPVKLNDLLTAFSAGIMLFAAVVGLIEPAVGIKPGILNILLACLGIICGAFFIKLISKSIPRIEKMMNISGKNSEEEAKIKSILLFVLAVAVHHLPEGIATGVSFGTGEFSDIVTVTSGIAIQNFPEGMIIIPPMLSLGIKKSKVLAVAFISGSIEIAGTFTGFLLVNISSVILPFILAFAGGTILFVICENMIPEIKRNINSSLPSFVVLLGFCFMCVINGVI